MSNDIIIVDAQSAFSAQNLKQITFKNGQRMPLVGLGMWQTDDPAELENAVDLALQAGYRHFDTATLYKNEAGLGNALKKWTSSGKVKREDLFIVTKLPWTGMQPELVERFMKSSLKALQLDYVDLYLVHFPVGLKFITEEDLVPMKDGKILYDKTTSIENVWKAMEDQVTAGRAKSVGISNFNEKQIDRIMKVAKIPPANHQIEVQVYFQQKPLREVCAKHKISICAYGPLGSPGRKNYSFPGIEPVLYDLLQDPVVTEIARKHGKTTGQVLLRFLTQLGIAVIPKSTNTERLRQNISIFDFELTNVDMRRLESLDKGEKARSFPGFTSMMEHPECPWTLVS